MSLRAVVPLNVRESALPVPGARLYVREVGGGPPLVVLHGGPDFDHHYLLPELDRLAGAFRLVYYDQRGRGRSAAGVAPEDVTIATEMDDLDRLRESLGLETIALLGHSWGGLLAMEYAARHPERVSHLVLLDPAPGRYADMIAFRERREATEPGTLARMRAIAATPEYLAGDVAAEAAYYRLHFGTTVRRPEQLDDLLGKLRAHFTPEGIVKARAIESRLYQQTWRRPDYDLMPALARSTARAVVIHGTRDLIPLDCARHAAAALPDARLVILDSGHFSYVERPAEVLDAVVACLARS